MLRRQILMAVMLILTCGILPNPVVRAANNTMDEAPLRYRHFRTIKGESQLRRDVRTQRQLQRYERNRRHHLHHRSHYRSYSRH